MSKPIVLCDVDGVIADFTGAVLRLANDVCARRQEVPRPFTHVDVDQWSFKDALQLTDTEWRHVVFGINEPGFAIGLGSITGSTAAIMQLAKTTDLYFLTSPWYSSPTWCHERTDWLCNRFGKEQGRKVIHTSHKGLIRGDFLIDDKPGNINDWVREQLPRQRYDNRWQAFLWDAPYNQDFHYALRVNSWEQIEEVIHG